MSERQKQLNFLKWLMEIGNTDLCRDLQQRLQKAEHDELSVRRKICLAIVMGVISIAGFLYIALFVPGSFEYSPPVLVKLFSVMGLAAVICVGVFFVCFLWYRALVNHVQRESRQVVQALLESRLAQPNPAIPAEPKSTVAV